MEGWKEQVRKHAFVQSYRHKHTREDTRKGKTELRSGWAQRTLWFLKHLQYRWFLLELAAGRGQSMLCCSKEATIMVATFLGMSFGATLLRLVSQESWLGTDGVSLRCFWAPVRDTCTFAVFYIRLYPAATPNGWAGMKCTLLFANIEMGFLQTRKRRAWVRACSGSGNKPHVLNDGCSKWKHVVSKQHALERKDKRGMCKCICQACEILWC